MASGPLSRAIAAVWGEDTRSRRRRWEARSAVWIQEVDVDQERSACDDAGHAVLGLASEPALGLRGRPGRANGRDGGRPDDDAAGRGDRRVPHVAPPDRQLGGRPAVRKLAHRLGRLAPIRVRRLLDRLRLEQLLAHDADYIRGPGRTQNTLRAPSAPSHAAFGAKAPQL